MKKIIFILVAGAGALIAANAFAEHHEQKGEGDMDAKMAAHFAELDANGDGNISRKEFLSYKEKQAKAQWAKMAESAGDDGVISMEEMSAIHQAMMQKMHGDHEMHGMGDGMDHGEMGGGMEEGAMGEHDMDHGGDGHH